jgi:hypothetical protein
MSDLDDLIAPVTAATTESAQLDFKAAFDTASAQDWCELIKDLVAMANSGGGCILIGVNDDGSISGADASAVLRLDSAKLVDKVFSYTGVQHSPFAVVPVEFRGTRLPVIGVGAAKVPIAFTNPGTYSKGDGKQAAAFARGTVYVRHGAKSEPCTTEDLRNILEARLAEERASLLANVRRVFEAPVGKQLLIVPIEEGTAPNNSTQRVTFTSDPTAPAYRPTSPDETHPYRQKELVLRVNERLKGRAKINSHDMQCVRKAHKINASRPEFFQERRFASAQYSEVFVDWIVAQYEADSSFFEKARRACRPGW